MAPDQIGQVTIALYANDLCLLMTAKEMTEKNALFTKQQEKNIATILHTETGFWH